MLEGQIFKQIAQISYIIRKRIRFLFCKNFMCIYMIGRLTHTYAGPTYKQIYPEMPTSKDISPLVLLFDPLCCM